MNNIKITNNAIQYLVDMGGWDKEEAEEHLITAISMCRISSPQNGVVELAGKIAELEKKAQERWIKFDHNVQTKGSVDYWMGRRDEAGYFQDLFEKWRKLEAVGEPSKPSDVGK